MENDILEIRNKCVTKSKFHPLTLKDFKVVYYLWNDDTVSRTKLKDELKRDKYTLAKIDKYIKEYLKDYQIENVDDIILEEIYNEYIKV